LFGLISVLGPSCGNKPSDDHHAAARAGFPCVECHRPDYDAAKTPEHVSAGYPTTCQQCHSLDVWRPATFGSHDAYWPLTGAHADAACASCHAGGVYAGTARECAGCHGPDFDATTKPNHADAGFPSTCELCHGTVAWVPSTFDHEATWPLTGAHQEAACVSCHATGYAGTARECQGCHLSDWEKAADPDHAKLALPKTCEACHGTAAWAPADYAGHDAIWPLLGKHALAACESCHADGHYADTPTDCVGCHKADYDGTTDPVHADVGYPTSCAVCHGTDGWKPAVFDHDAKWPLTGAHAEAACESCHADGQYAGTPDTCVGCHQADFDGTTDPDHAALGLPTTCNVCHGTAAWEPAEFAGHDPIWPLLGKHADAACESCHAEGYKDTPTGCDDCHHPDYVGAVQPDHAGPGYPLDCALCHSPADWKPSPFDHEAKWPLTGAHAEAQCSSCHADQLFVGTVNTCVGCHLVDFDGATDPDHTALGLPTTCNVCHGTAGWEPAEFDGHDAIWPLLGEHADATCESCHAAGYTNTPTTCDGCHHTDYVDSLSPAHQTEGYPTACETCHAPAGWKPSSFNHDAKWPLTEAHSVPACSSCHAGGKFAGTPTACFGCHEDNYLAALDPDHAGLGFPQKCETCHSKTAWEPSNFEGHDAIWPLLGEHANATCESCHAAGYTNTPTTCDGCHHTDYVESLSPAHQTEGYPTSCESCHAPAGWKPAPFNHTSWWALTGAHTTTSCAQCHVGGQGPGIPTSCNGCHAPDFAATTNPSHVKWELSSACDTCHSTAAWPPATFTKTVHDKFFTLTSGSDHKDFACTDCHKTPQWSDWICVSCHTGEHTLSKMNDKHDGDVPKYASTMAAAASPDLGCKSCHPDGEKK
jgi:hypothetical protein